MATTVKLTVNGTPRMLRTGLFARSVTSTRAGGVACGEVDLRRRASDTAESRGASLSVPAAGREPTERAADFSSWWLEGKKS